jgi:hypothetical protein
MHGALIIFGMAVWLFPAATSAEVLGLIEFQIDLRASLRVWPVSLSPRPEAWF